MIDYFLHFFSSIVSILGYTLTFFVAFFEFFIFTWWFFPWTLLFSIIVFLSLQWVYNIYIVAFVWFLWSFLGNLISYYIWYKKWKKHENNFLFFKKRIFNKAKNFFHKYHFFSLIFWKIIPWIKETISFVVWLFQLPKTRFFMLTFFWTLFWVFIIFFINYLFSLSLKFSLLWLDRISLIFSLIFLFLLLFLLIWYYIFNFIRWFYLIFLNFIKFIFRKIWLYDKLKYIFSKHNKVLYLFVFLLAIFYLILSYIGFLRATYNNFFVNYLDDSVHTLFLYLQEPILTRIFIFISFFWKFSTIFIFMLLFTIFLKKTKHIKYIFPMWFVFVLLCLVVFFTKIIIARPRPLLSIYIENSYSFPSFHASLAMYFYMLLFYFLFVKQKWWQNKVNMILTAILIIFLIWLSRLYLWVHYFSDVFAWYLLWFISFLLFLFLYKTSKNRLKKRIEKIKVPIYFVFFLIFFLFYSLFSYYHSIKFNNLKLAKQKYLNIENVKNYFDKHSFLKYTTTISWRKTEPINFIFLAKSDKELEKFFIKSGFVKADKINIKNVWKLGMAVYDKVPYLKAPFLPLFWNKKIQIFGFQKQDKNNLKKRHHIRIWKTNLKKDWYFVYVACAIFDNGIKWKITHKISPNLDKEREYFIASFLKSKQKFTYKKIQILPFTRWKNFSYDNFFTDGKIYIIKIK